MYNWFCHYKEEEEEEKNQRNHIDENYMCKEHVSEREKSVVFILNDFLGI